MRWSKAIIRSICVPQSSLFILLYDPTRINKARHSVLISGNLLLRESQNSINIKITVHDTNKDTITNDGQVVLFVTRKTTDFSHAPLNSVMLHWLQWTKISGAWLKSLEHDWSQWSMTEISGAWLKSVEHDWNQWSMTDISGLKSVEHDWNQWTEISGAWLKFLFEILINFDARAPSVPLLNFPFK